MFVRRGRGQGSRHLAMFDVAERRRAAFLVRLCTSFLRVASSCSIALRSRPLLGNQSDCLPSGFAEIYCAKIAWLSVGKLWNIFKNMLAEITSFHEPLTAALKRKALRGEPGSAHNRVLAGGEGWRVVEVLCTSGPG